jgi:excisionase family DNA binding protein
MSNSLNVNSSESISTNQLFDSTNSKEWMTAHEAADFLGVTTNALRIRVHRGQITAYKLGPRMLRFRRRDLQKAFTYKGG